VACLLAASIALAGCGGSSAKRFQPGRWLSTDPAHRVATLTLRAEGDGVSLGDFNGYSRGQVLVQVPLDWRVIVRCVNGSTSAAQSCAIVTNSLSATPAFHGASTPDPTVGLDPGSSASFSFVAIRVGSYRIASLVDDEEIGNGMWDALEIAHVQQPSVRLLRRIP
jgi:sulfocyanin SoxE-like protein